MFRSLMHGVIAFVALCCLAAPLKADLASAIANAQRREAAADRFAPRVVQELRNRINAAKQLLQEAISESNEAKANLANSQFIDAARIARTEVRLRRQIRKAQRRLRNLRRRSRKKNVSANLSLRNATAILGTIRDRRSFERLDHGFVRRQLSLARAKINLASREPGVIYKSIAERLRKANERGPRGPVASKCRRRVTNIEGYRRRVIGQLSKGSAEVKKMAIEADQLLIKAREEMQRKDFLASNESLTKARELYERAFNKLDD